MVHVLVYVSAFRTELRSELMTALSLEPMTESALLGGPKEMMWVIVTALQLLEDYLVGVKVLVTEQALLEDYSVGVKVLAKALALLVYVSGTMSGEKMA